MTINLVILKPINTLLSPFFSQTIMDFIKVNGTRFILGSRSYFIKGANYWQGMNLAAEKEFGGDRHRLCIELDQMKQMGVNNLRIMAASEGPDDQPYRMIPSLQPAPGRYNEYMFEALDFLLDEMSKRELTAVRKLDVTQ